MATESKILLNNINTISADSSFSYSDKDQGPGYLKSGDGIGTVTFDLNNYTGIIKLQATLAQYPSDDDWFDIEDTEFSEELTTDAKTATFTGKFMFIRAAYYLFAGTITQARYTF